MRKYGGGSEKNTSSVISPSNSPASTTAGSTMFGDSAKNNSGEKGTVKGNSVIKSKYGWKGSVNPSSHFQGQGPGGGPQPQLADKNGHQMRQGLWDKQQKTRDVPFVPQSSSSRKRNQGLVPGKGTSIQDMHSFILHQGGSRSIVDPHLPREFQNTVIPISSNGGNVVKMTNLPPDIAKFAKPFVSRNSFSSQVLPTNSKKTATTMKEYQKLVEDIGKSTNVDPEAKAKETEKMVENVVSQFGKPMSKNSVKKQQKQTPPTVQIMRPRAPTKINVQSVSNTIEFINQQKKEGETHNTDGTKSMWDNQLPPVKEEEQIGTLFTPEMSEIQRSISKTIQTSSGNGSSEFMVIPVDKKSHNVSQ